VEVEELKKKVDKIEYTDIKGLQDDVADIKSDLKVNSLLTQQSIDSAKELSQTLQSVKTTMVQISSNMEKMAENSVDLSNDVKDVKNDMNSFKSEVNEKIEEINDKSTIDWQLWIKQNWFGFVLGLGALGYAISQIVK